MTEAAPWRQKTPAELRGWLARNGWAVRAICEYEGMDPDVRQMLREETDAMLEYGDIDAAEFWKEKAHD